MAMMAAALAQKEGREREAATTFDKIKGRRVAGGGGGGGACPRDRNYECDR